MKVIPCMGFLNENPASFYVILSYVSVGLVIVYVKLRKG